ncbi:hypothetical protein KVR01_001707 [Diaporthe batatas]|uniref:uncharacterized protein n=1 Tax=Diaporthe batatas TaxID=748121 RepID=UPI001D053D20|nr:uncharacterized protein KVR01_001707 [Diaporthe batatas]KAG8168958.1 hypothetical protein KVR01_001707 [Diaporthe batatas]
MISRIHITAFSWLLCFSALVRGQTIGQLLQQTPVCAVSCFLEVLPPDPACLTSIDQLSSCICSNVTLLTTLSGCTRLSCEVSDQILGENALGQTCRGAPLFVESQATFLKVLAIAAIVLAVPSIGLRWYARCKSSTLGVDDYLALLATIALIAVSAVQLGSAFIGFGVHVWVVDPRMAIPLLRLYWVSQQLYVLDQLLTKISLLTLYLRVFPRTRWVNITARYGILVMVIQETIFYFLILLRCIPVSASWDIRQKGRCLDLNAIGFSGAILGIAEHLGILVMPLPELWKLKLSKRKRIMLAFVFSLGSFSLFTSVIRIRYVRKFAPTADLSWDVAPAISWSLIELLSTVICLNLPPCRQLLSKLIPRRLATTIHRGKNGTAPYGPYDTGPYGAFSQHGAQTIELKSKSPPMGGILHTTTIEVTHERNLSDDELLMIKTRPSVSSSASRRSLQTIDEEYDEPNERGRSKLRRPPPAATTRTPSVEVEIDRSRLGLYHFFPTKI